MLKQLVRVAVLVAAVAFAWRYSSRPVLTVNLEDHVAIDAPSRKTFRILADVETYFHKIHPLYVDPPTLVDRFMRSREIIEWKFRGKQQTHSIGLLADMVESEVVILSNMFDSAVTVNTSSWVDFSAIVFHTESSDANSVLTCRYRLYFPWLGKLFLQGTLIENSRKYQRQMLENVKSLVEAD
ncbi:uncharacterized protein LOC134190106 [Corticium candelabrum]|uniref:uncharacterized protein LOC134190106 n=1 Tax=Corticium candelabrum TaxID=121492 RepID=UPI002E26534C|nr:uncharacterized protein LOC134190106 [Corticium candelabrum]